MSQLAILFGLLLNAVGLVGFFGTGASHPTALIPCVLGVLLIICGFIARKESLHMHAMHVAVLIALIGFLATASSFIKIWSLFSATSALSALSVPATLSKFATALLCGIFFVLCVRSFVRARILKKYQ